MTNQDDPRIRSAGVPKGSPRVPSSVLIGFVVCPGYEFPLLRPIPFSSSSNCAILCSVSVYIHVWLWKHLFHSIHELVEYHIRRVIVSPLRSSHQPASHSLNMSGKLTNPSKRIDEKRVSWLDTKCWMCNN